LSVQNGKTPMRSEHRKHDRLLVTRFAMDDAYPSERDEARQLVQSCPDCAALAADIRHISNAVGIMPVPPRSRDFTIAASKAEELRGSRLSRWMRGFATPGWGMLRPVAGVALSVGLVMALVGTALPATLPAAAPEGGALTLSATGAPTEAQPLPTSEQEPNGPPPDIAAPGAGEGTVGDSGRDGPVDAEDFESASQDPITQEFNAAYASPDTLAAPVPEDGDLSAAADSRDTPRDLLVWTGLLIAVISVGLLALAWTARRYFADPLVR
jgi:hypothetical protein